MWKHTKRKKEGGGQKYVTYIRKIVWVLFKDVTIEVALRDNAPRVFSLLLHAISPLSYLSLSLSLPSNAPPSLSLPLPSSRSLPCRSSLSSSHPPGEKAWLRERLEAANATKSSVARGLRSGAPRFLARVPSPFRYALVCYDRSPRFLYFAPPFPPFVTLKMRGSWGGRQ